MYLLYISYYLNSLFTFSYDFSGCGFITEILIYIFKINCSRVFYVYCEFVVLMKTIVKKEVTYHLLKPTGFVNSNGQL